MVTKITSYVLSANAVTSAAIANNTITSNDIANSAITTAKISNNSVDGTKIAMGSDAQGDIIYYNGTDYARLAAGTAGQFLKTNGAAANPSWADPITESANANGYVTFPGGTTLQWGTTASIAQDTASTAISFPVAFTTAVYSITITPIGAISTASAGTDSVNTVTTSSFIIQHGSDTARTFYWQAIGK